MNAAPTVTPTHAAAADRDRPGPQVDLRDGRSTTCPTRAVEELLRGVLASLEPLAPMELRLMEALGCTLADTVPPVSAVLAPGSSTSSSTTIDDVLPAGLQLSPAHLALLASRGYERVMARPRPRVVVLSLASAATMDVIATEHAQRLSGEQPSTDDQGEADGADALTQRLLNDSEAPWHQEVDEHLSVNPDVNGYLLAAAAQTAGGVAFRAGWVAPIPGRLREAVDNELLRADAVIISGATEPVVRRRVEAELSQLGWVGYTSVAMEPGQVQGLGRVGANGCPVFLLSDNPVEAFVSFEAVVRPVIRYLLGTATVQRQVITARCSRHLDVAAGPCAYVPARLEQDEQGQFVATPLTSPLSVSLYSPVEELAGTNALIMVQEGCAQVNAGEHVSVAVLD